MQNEIVLTMRGICKYFPGVKALENVNFTLRKGEILGVGGLVGAQRTELMEGIFGIRSHTKGQVIYKGKEMKINRPKDAIDQGIALLTEDRRGSGIMGVLSVADNISIASLDKYLDFGISINSRKVEQLVQDELSDVQKYIIRRHEYEGAKLEVIAYELGMNPPAVRMQLSRARKTIRERYYEQSIL